MSLGVQVELLVHTGSMPQASTVLTPQIPYLIFPAPTPGLLSFALALWSVFITFNHSCPLLSPCVGVPSILRLEVFSVSRKFQEGGVQPGVLEA